MRRWGRLDWLLVGLIALAVLAAAAMGAAEEKPKRRLRVRWKSRTVTVKALRETKSRHLRYFYEKRAEVYGAVKNETDDEAVGLLGVSVRKRRRFKLKGQRDYYLICETTVAFGPVEVGKTANWSCQFAIWEEKKYWSNRDKRWKKRWVTRGLKSGEYVKVVLLSPS